MQTVKGLLTFFYMSHRRGFRYKYFSPTVPSRYLVVSATCGQLRQLAMTYVQFDTGLGVLPCKRGVDARRKI